MFIDLADPEKRTREDIAYALDLVGRFQSHFEVILGLNEKESSEIGRVLNLDAARPLAVRPVTVGRADPRPG